MVFRALASYLLIILPEIVYDAKSFGNILLLGDFLGAQHRNELYMT